MRTATLFLLAFIVLAAPAFCHLPQPPRLNGANFLDCDSSTDGLELVILDPVGGNDCAGSGTAVPHSCWCDGDTLAWVAADVTLELGDLAFLDSPLGIANGGTGATNVTDALAFLNLEYHDLVFVTDAGDVGIGTDGQLAPLHIVVSGTPFGTGDLIVQNNSSTGLYSEMSLVSGTAGQSNILFGDSADENAGEVSYDNSDNSFTFRTNGATSMTIDNAAGVDIAGSLAVATDNLVVASGGDVGIGTASPAADLHIKDASGNAELTMETSTQSWKWRTNTANDQMNVIDDTNSKTPLRIAANSDNNLLQIGVVAVNQVDIAGNLTITGGLVTTGGGGACTVGDPCDGVFSDDFHLPSIEQHAAEMWKGGFLPAIGPTPENGPMDVTRKVGGLINELEKAHIYIEQLNDRLSALEGGSFVGTETYRGAVNEVVLVDTVELSADSVLGLQNGSVVVCPVPDPAASICATLPLGTDGTFHAIVPAEDSDAAALGAFQATGVEIHEGPVEFWNDSWRIEGCITGAEKDPGGLFLEVEGQAFTQAVFCPSGGTLGPVCEALVGQCAEFSGSVPAADDDLFGVALRLRSILVGTR